MVFRSVLLCAAAIGLATVSAFSEGQSTARVAAGSEARDLGKDYPNRPIRFIVPFPPGGATDILARTIGQKLTESWGQQVVIDNRPGAGATIGAEIAAKSAPDGHTILLVSVAHAINAGLHKKLPYNILRDFALVTLVATSPLILVVHPSAPANSVRELIALAKSKPGQLSYASAGNGTAAHLAAELFRTMAGLDLVHIPYKGGAPGLIDLMGGRVSLMFPNMPTALPPVKAGKLRPLAVTSSKRSPEAPDVPTVAEVGVPGYEVNTWYGVAAPAGTPKRVIRKLNAEIAKILNVPDVIEHLSRQGLELISNTPEQFAAHMKAEMEKWRKVIDAAGIRAD